MRHLDLFSGIGGFSLAADWVWLDIEHIFCDNEPFSQAILRKHWPNSKIYGDIRTLTADAERNRLDAKHSSETQTIQGTKRPYAEKDTEWERRTESSANNKHYASLTDAERRRYAHRESEKQSADAEQQTLGNTTDGLESPFLITGGFPCQPFSQAGRRMGTADDRHLWPEMLRVIREFHPRWVIAENVGGIITWNGGMVFQQVCSDLESAKYEVQSFVVPAVAVNAPHRRDRVWFVAHNERQRYKRDKSEARPSTRPNRRQLETRWDKNWLEVATQLCTLDDGLPNGLARPRGWRNAALKGAGNAIVPQVAYEIMKAIKLTEEI